MVAAIQTRTAEVSANADGCVVIRIRAGAEQTLADAQENLSATQQACGGRRQRLIVDISRGLPLQPEVRHFYTGEKLVQSFLALALLVEASPFGRIMGNVYLRIARPGIPTRLFADESAAVEWLRTHQP